MGHAFGVWVTKKFAPGFHEHLISRTRFIDELIEEKAAQGRQYVILGAGYDTCSSTEATIIPTIFRVDQIEVQTRSAQITKDAPNAENITYVTIDFNHRSSQNSFRPLFDQSKSTIVTLEGVSQIF